MFSFGVFIGWLTFYMVAGTVVARRVYVKYSRQNLSKKALWFYTTSAFLGWPFVTF